MDQDQSIQSESTQTENLAQLHFYKKWIAVAGIVVLFIILILGSLFFFQKKTAKISQQKLSAMTPHVQKSAHLYFQPTSILLSSSNQSQSVKIILSTGEDTTGVNLDMVFNPKAFNSISLFAPGTTVFGNQGSYKVIKNETNISTGVMHFSLTSTHPDQPSQKQTGVVAILSFTRNPSYSQNSTTIAFLNTSIVTQRNTPVSILGKADPLSIYFLH